MRQRFEAARCDRVFVDMYHSNRLEVILMRPLSILGAVFFFCLLVPDVRSKELSSSELSRLEWTKLTSLEPKESSVGHGLSLIHI